MTDYWIGTSGWQYDHWRARFYPPGLPKRAWFDFYTQSFRTVEVNNSFYRQPKVDTWKAWAAAAPQAFRYAVKANRFITHIKRFAGAEEPLENFFKGARWLGPSLGPVLFQTPPNFRRTPENLERLERFLPLLPAAYKSVFEFRDKSWFGKDTLDLLRRHDAGFCSYDKSGADCPLTATADLAYIRFHGSEQTYASNYTEDMLQAWARRLRRLAADVDSVWVFFNNDAQAFAVHNALRLRELLGV